MVVAGKIRDQKTVAIGLVIVLLLIATVARADDGYRLWLRYDQLPSPAADRYRSEIAAIVVAGESPTSETIRSELTAALSGLLGTAISTKQAITDRARQGCAGADRGFQPAQSDPSLVGRDAIDQ